MRLFIYLAFIAAILHCSFAPPVTPDKRKEEEKDENDLVSIFFCVQIKNKTY